MRHSRGRGGGDHEGQIVNFCAGLNYISDYFLQDSTTSKPISNSLMRNISNKVKSTSGSILAKSLLFPRKEMCFHVKCHKEINISQAAATETTEDIIVSFFFSLFKGSVSLYKFDCFRSYQILLSSKCIRLYGKSSR